MRISTILIAAIALAMVTLYAVAGTSQDTYIGNDDHGMGDRIGPEIFEISSMETSMETSSSNGYLSVSIRTSFAGRASPGVGVDTYGVGYGDVFIGTWDGKPFSDFSAIYALSLDSRDANGGVITLYHVTDASIVHTEDVTSPGGIFRNGQLALVDPTGLVPMASGQWETAPGLIRFVIDDARIDTTMVNSIYWGETCGNDVIIGVT